MFVAIFCYVILYQLLKEIEHLYCRVLYSKLLLFPILTGTFEQPWNDFLSSSTFRFRNLYRKSFL